MKSEHSPEPWYAWTGVVHVHIFDKDNIDDDSPNRPIAKLEINDYDTVEHAEADAARIVACVNACAGLNPEVVPELVGMLEECRVALKFGYESTGKDLVGMIEELLGRVKG